MPLVNTKDMLQEAVVGGYAVGGFNIVNELSARAVVSMCEELRSPVILQTSVATVKQIGVRNLIGFLHSIAQNATIPVAIHLDHCRDVGLCRACIDAGWSSVMIDASHLPLAENISMTGEIVRYAAGKGVSVEGELGLISGTEDEIFVVEADSHLASLRDSITYTGQTGIDLFAPAIGTAHGVYKGEPKIDFQRLADIRQAVSQPLVVHGGTGLAPDVLQKLIRHGAAKINISTALKTAYLSGIQTFMLEHPDNSNPLKLDLYVEGYIKKMARGHIELFGSSARV